MKSLVKYILHPLHTELALPKEAELLRITTTQTDAILWVLTPQEPVAPINSPDVCNEEMEIRHFQVFYENQTVDNDAKYIDSFSLDNGYTHRHLFEIKR